MDSSDLIVLSPPSLPDAALAIAACRAGARGTLDLEFAVRAWLVSNVGALAFLLFEFGRHGRLLAPRDLLADRELWRDAAGVVVSETEQVRAQVARHRARLAQA